ncbi:MAG: RAD55 family ATPase [Promethearchaeati archaeon SRVP18_Atabeyarchaeia-1]
MVISKLSGEFGLPVLDEALGGGVPRGSVLLLEEDTGLSSDVLVTLFVAGGLHKDENVFVLNTDYPPSTIKELLSNQGINLEEVQGSGKLTFMNAFGIEETPTEKPYSVIHNVSDLREIHNNLKAYSEKVKPPSSFRGIVDSLSTIILCAAEATGVFPFMRNQVILQKKYGGIILFTLHTKAHSSHLVSAIEHIVDGVLELRKERYYRDWRSILQIKKLVGREFSTREFSYIVREGKLVVE